ncbi:MAG: shikimate dehydrogenase [Deltaproteobacteria bacterium]|nr:MAG: shikimate dehydrogenase [Deltaproteobacteria bacterium]
MAATDDIAQIQTCISNPLDRDIIGKKKIAGVIGDCPSRYSKSPALWNAAFDALNIDAVYLPLDVDEPHLPTLVEVLRKSERVMGASVTTPHKVRIMEHLDQLDEKASHIGAVNTIARTQDGRLVGYNTDGQGFLHSVLAPPPGQSRPFTGSLKGKNVLLIGAGGASRSLAFYLAEVLGDGRLLICNRTTEAARSLAESIKQNFTNVSAIHEETIGEAAPKVELIINGSTKGQGGIRKTGNGKITILEPYSALAPANPAAFPESEHDRPEFYCTWLRSSLADIEANNRRSWEISLSIPPDVGFCDLIYFPAETAFLRHGRLSGHPTLNGQGMIVAQAVDAFFDKVCREYLKKLGMHDKETYKRLSEIMYQAW